MKLYAEQAFSNGYGSRISTATGLQFSNGFYNLQRKKPISTQVSKHVCVCVVRVASNQTQQIYNNNTTLFPFKYSFCLIINLFLKFLFYRVNNTCPKFFPTQRLWVFFRVQK